MNRRYGTSILIMVYQYHSEWYTNITQNGIPISLRMVYQYHSEWYTNITQNGIPISLRMVYQYHSEWYTNITQNGIPISLRMVYQYVYLLVSLVQTSRFKWAVYLYIFSFIKVLIVYSESKY